MFLKKLQCVLMLANQVKTVPFCFLSFSKNTFFSLIHYLYSIYLKRDCKNSRKMFKQLNWWFRQYII